MHHELLQSCRFQPSVTAPVILGPSRGCVLLPSLSLSPETILAVSKGAKLLEVTIGVLTLASRPVGSTRLKLWTAGKVMEAIG